MFLYGIHLPHTNVLNGSVQNAGFGFVNRINLSLWDSTEIIDSHSDFAAQPVAKIIVGPVYHGFVVGHCEEVALYEEALVDTQVEKEVK
jgi:hypothetical protein